MRSQVEVGFRASHALASNPVAGLSAAGWVRPLRRNDASYARASSILRIAVESLRNVVESLRNVVESLRIVAELLRNVAESLRNVVEPLRSGDGGLWGGSVSLPRGRIVGGSGGCKEFCVRQRGGRKESMATYRAELVDEILAGARTEEEIFGPDGVLKKLTAAMVERALGAELGFHLEQERKGQEEAGNRRNGVSRKTLQTDQGPVGISVPRDRNGTFEPQLVPKHSRRLAGFDEKVLGLYARGMSVREIQAHLEEFYATDVSPELISRVTDAVWDEIRAWQSRPLERCYAAVWLDALFVKVRDQGIVKNQATYVAVGLRLDGRKEVLGLWMDESEGAKFWLGVLTELRNRGVEDVLFCCCDGLKGFPQAIEASFPKAVVQTCVVHQVRYSLSFVGWRDRKNVAASLRAIYAAPSVQAAQSALEDFERQWGNHYPAIAPAWRARWGQLTAFLDYPPEIRRMIYTTNAIESLNYQLRKVIKAKGHFPSQDASTKVLFLAIRNIEKNWARPVNHWSRIYNQLIVAFGEDRVTNMTSRTA